MKSGRGLEKEVIENEINLYLDILKLIKLDASSYFQMIFVLSMTLSGLEIEPGHLIESKPTSSIKDKKKTGV